MEVILDNLEPAASPPAVPLEASISAMEISDAWVSRRLLTLSLGVAALRMLLEGGVLSLDIDKGRSRAVGLRFNTDRLRTTW